MTQSGSEIGAFASMANPKFYGARRKELLGNSLYRELNHPLIASLNASYPLPAEKTSREA
jgi:hypothetical protein